MDVPKMSYHQVLATKIKGERGQGSGSVSRGRLGWSIVVLSYSSFLELNEQ